LIRVGEAHERGGWRRGRCVRGKGQKRTDAGRVGKAGRVVG
jgi:hypothetical protein